MTSQIRDTLSIDGKTYAIQISSNPSQLFDPRAVGMNLAPIGSASTACNRCFYCQYAIVDRQLFLVELNLYPTYADDIKFKYGRINPLLGGKSPDSDGRGNMWRYRDIKLPIDYSGGLAVGSGYVRIEEIDTFSRMNTPIILSETIYEIIFDAGNLIEVIDRSVQVREMRDRVIQEYACGINKTNVSWYQVARDILRDYFKFQY